MFKINLMKKTILISVILFQVVSILFYFTSFNAPSQTVVIRKGVNQLLAGSTVFMDATNGNDSTALRGDESKPFLSLSNACDALLDNDKLLIKPGRYIVKAGSGVNPKSPIDQPPLSSWRGASATIRWKTNIVVEGYGATLIIPTNICDTFDIVECTNITFRGIQFETPVKLSGLALTGLCSTIQFRGLNRDWKVQDCRFINSIDQCVGSVYSWVKSTNGMVFNNFFYRCGSTNSVNPVLGDGACVVNAGSRIIIEGNQFLECFRGVEIERDAGGGSHDKYADYIIKNNRFDDIYEQAIGILNSGAAGTDEIDNIIVEGNQFTGHTDTGISYLVPCGVQAGAGVTRLKIHDNTFRNFNFSAGAFGVNILSSAGQDVKDLTITDNFFSDSQYGISAANGGSMLNTNCVIARNCFSRMANNAIIFQGQRGFIVNNIINGVGNNGDLPIRLQENGGIVNQFNTIAANSIYAVLANSIYLTAGGNNNYVNNNFMAGYTAMPIRDLNAVNVNFIGFNNYTNGLRMSTNNTEAVTVPFYISSQPGEVSAIIASINPNTNIFEFWNGPAKVGGFNSNAIPFYSISNSSTAYLPHWTLAQQGRGFGSSTNTTTTTNSLWGPITTGSLTLDGGFWQDNRAIGMDMSGDYWTGTTPGTCRFNISLAATNIATTTVIPPNSVAGGFWRAHVDLNCWTNSATVGAINASGYIEFFGPNGGVQTNATFTNITAIFNTTTNHLFGFSSTNGATTDSFLSRNGILYLR